MKLIIPVKFSGVSLNLNNKHLNFFIALQRIEFLGQYSTRVPSAHRRICHSFCNCEKISTILIFAPMQR